MTTLGDICKRLGLDDMREKGVSYDFAVPVDWANEIQDKIGIYPRNIVWLYDIHGVLGPKCGIFGRPYPITMYGWQILTMAINAEKCKR